MDWYYCNECGEFFSEDEADCVSDFHAELIGMGGDCSETFMVCPHCGSDDFDYANECELCGDPIQDGHFCEDCKVTFFAKMDEFFEGIKTENKVDNDVINDLIEDYFDSK